MDPLDLLASYVCTKVYSSRLKGLAFHELLSQVWTPRRVGWSHCRLVLCVALFWGPCLIERVPSGACGWLDLRRMSSPCFRLALGAQL